MIFCESRNIIVVIYKLYKTCLGSEFLNLQIFDEAIFSKIFKMCKTGYQYFYIDIKDCSPRIFKWDIEKNKEHVRLRKFSLFQDSRIVILDCK